ncbi:PI31 proteasome regulator domain-containing protein [Sarocladium implicatum]|nr:PI31 proteasome regulator domain-containing protein [Sarocladium implicatum]
MATLTTDAILQGMADALPTNTPSDDSSALASSYEVIGLLIHSYLAALGFRLCAECESLAPRLPSQWNNGFGSLSFVYAHKQSSMRFVFRVDRMGAKVEIRGLAVGDEHIHRFERTLREVVDNSALPIRIPVNGEGEEDRSGLKEKLRAVFVSEQDLKVKIIQKLIPKLQHEGYIETAEAEETANSERRAQEARNPGRPFPGQPAQGNIPPPNPYPHPDLARPRPGAPSGEFLPPGFEDEYDINRPPAAGSGLRLPGRSPFNIGHDDLNPPGLGPHDPLRGSFVGGGLPRPGGSGGMHPTFDDPLFQGPGGGSGQGGYDPQAPPGARWDPLGPGDGMRFPGQGGGRGSHPFGDGSGGFGGGGFGGGGII